jgi:hypothetical protein
MNDLQLKSIEKRLELYDAIAADDAAVTYEGDRLVASVQTDKIHNLDIKNEIEWIVSQLPRLQQYHFQMMDRWNSLSLNRGNNKELYVDEIKHCRSETSRVNDLIRRLRNAEQMLQSTLMNHRKGIATMKKSQLDNPDERKTFEDDLENVRDSLKIAERITANGEYDELSRRSFNLLTISLPQEVCELIRGIWRHDPNFPKGRKFEEIWCLSPEGVYKLLGEKIEKDESENRPRDEEEIHDYLKQLFADKERLDKWHKKQQELKEFREGRKELFNDYVIKKLTPKLQSILEDLKEDELARLTMNGVETSNKQEWTVEEKEKMTVSDGREGDREKEILKNENRVLTGKVLELKKKIKAPTITEKELRDIVDATRKSKNKINYSKVGKQLGVHHTTAKRWIKLKGIE